MPSVHCIRAAAAALMLGVARVASAQPLAVPEAATANLTVFLRGTPIGSEQVTVSRTAEGWTVSASGRLGAPAGADIPAYGAPAVAFTIHVGDSSAERIQTTARLIAARRTAVKLVLPGASLDADIWTDEAGRMIRLSVPAQSLEVVREDIASISSRSVPISRPNDEAVKIPANGFVLAGTLSRPAQTTAARLPAVILVGGSGPSDRDGLAFGIPVLGEIANATADAGFITLRYDKRGI